MKDTKKDRVENLLEEVTKFATARETVNRKVKGTEEGTRNKDKGSR